MEKAGKMWKQNFTYLNQNFKTSMNKVDVGENQDKIANYKMFVKFLESIVAYHKFHWG